jgi:hypothetical protein
MRYMLNKNVGCLLIIRQLVHAFSYHLISLLKLLFFIVLTPYTRLPLINLIQP